MRKITLFLLSTFFILLCHAQFDKGSTWIAGSSSFSYNTGKSDDGQGNTGKNNLFKIGFTPSFNKATSTNQLQSFFIGYTFARNKNEANLINVQEENQHEFVLGYGKKRFSPLFRSLYSTIGWNMFGEYAFMSQETTANSIKTSVRNINELSINFNISLGLMYKLNDRFLITTNINNFLFAQLGSSKTETEFSNTTLPRVVQESINVNGGFGLSGFSLSSLQFGLLYKLK